ncbi:MAG: alpha/beta fold hydrolase [Pseudomonadota bacterium]
MQQFNISRFAAFILSACLAAAGCSDVSEDAGASTASAAAPEFKERPCAFPMVPEGMPGLDRFTCGSVSVPVRPGDDTAGTVDIGLAILSAANQGVKKNDPILYLQGGPGAPSIAMAPPWAASPMAMDRDIIFYDRRGTHFSGPKLCPDTSFALVGDIESDYSYDEYMNDYIERVSACRSEMTEKGHAPQDYTISRISEDLESVRRALGVSSWNLIGHSAGGPQVLDMMHRYPDSIRSVILESVTNIQAEPYGEFFFNVFGRSLEKLFADCAASPQCAAMHPDPEKLMMDALASFEQQPMKLAVPTPSGEPGPSVFLNQQDLIVLLFSQTYNAKEIPNILNMIKAAEQRNKEVFAPLAGMFSFLEDMSAEDVRLSIECDHYLTVDPSKEIPTPATPLQDVISKGMPPGLQFSEVCEVFAPDVTETNINPAPPTADIPVLVMTGEYDAIIPSSVGQNIANGLKRSYYVNFEYASHQLFVPHPCTHNVGKAFFDSPFEEPDSLQCQAEINSPFAKM